AEHGGALGGVVNVVLKQGSNGYHGSGFFNFESDALDGAYTRINHDTLRYDPLSAPGSNSSTPFLDQAAQIYAPKADTFRIFQPGFTLGGPVKKDRLWFFVGFAPFGNSTDRTVNFNPSICSDPSNAGLCPNTSAGIQTFKRRDWLYYSTARLDANVTQKVRLFARWLYQYERETGATLPSADPIASESGTFLNAGTVGYLNQGILTNFGQYAPSHGWSQPNSTYNVGADLTLTPKIVATSRF